MRKGLFPGVKRSGHGVNHPPPPSAEVKDRVELHLYSPSEISWPVIGRTLPYRLIFQHNHCGLPHPLPDVHYTRTKQKTPHNSEVHRSLHNCGT
jgi:hypothetical protein